ncbi:acyl carrier protein [Gilliamella sp. B2776]|uniref:acyl carrier protein n=1 Tax=unclassified Gilliamella TaxID=2685620 RepID=UPI002269CDBD|nr:MULTISPECIES: acyl carrier protein [unclassified Gilliamella]MCX8649000.1 acyl carrier protein [Gilliamella sp. B2779]MCX8653124.1 acyl carrier protein [Gilliamella sp. B2737]MCX8655384.1 acyl carrier protein [Gilliamella sp. B2894]MCX8664149.1 acyl carrier protein [Gilliamella sp. B2887]MCX8690812.1 acyl carrier protein [Gilliamella sp. B2776]
MELFNFIVTQITELTDFDPEMITRDTLLTELDLVSLDYVSIEVALKKKYGVSVNMAELGQKQISTVGEFIDYLSQSL